MAEQVYVRSFTVGAATITLINVGNIRFDLSYVMKMAKDTPGYEHIFGEPKRVPIQCMLVQLPHTTVLVDASFYEIPPDSPYALPDYVPPPGLNARLAEIDVARDTIDAVVVTHLHFDHYSGLTEERDGAIVPCFPKARVYVPRADWLDPEMQKAAADSTSLAGRTLAVIERLGMLEPTEGSRTLADGVEIIHAPGETPGHQIVRVQSEGQTFYSLGDLYHDPVEIERPEWGTWWADPETTQASRRALVDAALRENAVLAATHLSTVGRLRRTDAGMTWEDI
jgi:glyoxylase-like metal-dependent hydrolase (beta-lactamase superfamily II)